MGSATSEKCSENSPNDNSTQGLDQRPAFYPCSECGRKFTMRALEIHKQSCSEAEDCTCVVCEMSRKKHSLSDEEIVFYDPTPLSPKKSKKEDIIRNQLRDLLKKSFQFRNFPQNVNDIRLVEKPVVTAPAINGSQQFILIGTEPCKTLLPVVTNSETEDKKTVLRPIKPLLKRPDSLESYHEGQPCNRKLFCSVCKEHVFWESFGTHALQHSIKAENNHLLCPECNDSRSSATYFLMHFYSHISGHPSDCPECRCEHPQCLDPAEVPLPEHCYAESVDHRCYICLKFFGHFQTLVNHMRLHSKEMPFSCTECKRSFRQIGNLQRHMTTHRGDRPHKCPNCCRSFADPATLRNHVRVHTRETPYVCTICNRGFSQVGNLKRHMALHVQKEANAASVKIMAEDNNDKHVGILEDAKTADETEPMATETENSENSIAESTVSSTNGDTPHTENNLQGRKRGKHGKFKLHCCTRCGKKYAWRHDLDIHFRVHTGERPYRCEICDKRFAQSGAVRIHKIRHHSGTTGLRIRVNRSR